MNQWNGPNFKGLRIHLISDDYRLNNKNNNCAMSQNLLEHTRSNRVFADLKQSLREIGCDVCDINELADVPQAIRNQCCTGPSAVVNATLMSGPGIKVTPIERKGYKISANDEAPITSDLTPDYKRGTSIHKVLFSILNHELPKAVREAVRAPRIADMEIFKVHEDGIDYFQNPYFGEKGCGRRTGLHPREWYVKIYTCAQVEPYYLDLAPMVEDLRREILWQARRETDKAIRRALTIYHNKYHRFDVGCKPPHHHGHHHPCRPGMDHEYGGFDPEGDPGFNVDPEEPGNDEPTVIIPPISDDFPIVEEGTGDCPICDKDENYGGFGGDDDFGVDAEGDDDMDWLESLNEPNKKD